MKKAGAIILGFLLALLAGCGHRNQMPPEQEAYLKREAAQPVTCKQGKDCQEKWNRAVIWVTHNSEYKIKTVTPDLIETHDVVYAQIKPSYKVPEFTVVRYETGDGIYQFDFSSACDEEYGCGSPGFVYRAYFYEFVMGIVH